MLNPYNNFELIKNTTSKNKGWNKIMKRLMNLLNSLIEFIGVRLFHVFVLSGMEILLRGLAVGCCHSGSIRSIQCLLQDRFGTDWVLKYSRKKHLHHYLELRKDQ